MRKFRLSKVRRSFMGQSIKMYNKLPKEALDLPLSKFKTYVKKVLMNNGYYTINAYLNDKNAWTLPTT